MKTNATLRITTVCALCLCLVITTLSFTSIAATTSGPLVDNDESNEEGAKHFDEGVRDVGTILTLDLSTENGVKQAAEIFRRNEKKLAKFEKKALLSAIRVASFQKGLKDEAAKRKGGDAELAKELELQPGAVGNIPGAEEAADAIKKSTRPAAETLQRVAEALKKAGDAAKQKNAPGNSHHAKSKTAETSLATIVGSSSSTSPALFCGSHQYICDLLTRLGLYVLRRQIAVLQSFGRKANCVVSAYATYGTCTVTRWWDQAYCVARLSTNVSNCLLFA